MQHFVRKIKEINWRRGNGEMLSFAITVPFLLFLIVAVVAFSKYAIAREQLTVATYAVGRAAVVSSSESLANARALAVLKTIYGNDNSGTYASSEAGHVWYSMKVEETPKLWRVGNIVDITLTQNVQLIKPFGDIQLTNSIAMMIEAQMELGK